MCFKFRRNTAVEVWSVWNLFHSARLGIVTCCIVWRKKATAVELFLRLWIEIRVVSCLPILKSLHQYHSDSAAREYFPLVVVGMTLCRNRYSIAQRLSFYVIIFLATLFCTLRVLPNILTVAGMSPTQAYYFINSVTRYKCGQVPDLVCAASMPMQWALFQYNTRHNYNIAILSCEWIEYYIILYNDMFLLSADGWQIVAPSFGNSLR